MRGATLITPALRRILIRLISSRNSCGGKLVLLVAVVHMVRWVQLAQLGY